MKCMYDETTIRVEKAFGDVRVDMTGPSSDMHAFAYLTPKLARKPAKKLKRLADEAVVCV